MLTMKQISELWQASSADTALAHFSMALERAVVERCIARCESRRPLVAGGVISEAQNLAIDYCINAMKEDMPPC